MPRRRPIAENCKRLRALPSGVAELTALTKLDAFGCEALQTLPQHLGQLTALQDLDISYTALATLPDSIGEGVKPVSAICNIAPSAIYISANEPSVGHIVECLQCIKIVISEPSSAAQAVAPL